MDLVITELITYAGFVVDILVKDGQRVKKDEVMVVLAPKPGQTVDPADLIGFLTPRMAHFMVPRYVRVVDALPKTPTTKIQKAGLREAGVTQDTWDREAHGMKLKAEKLS